MGKKFDKSLEPILGTDGTGNMAKDSLRKFPKYVQNNTHKVRGSTITKNIQLGTQTNISKQPAALAHLQASWQQQIGQTAMKKD